MADVQETPGDLDRADIPTRAEAFLQGLALVREGLALIGQAGGSRDQLLALLAGSGTAARRFREALKGEPALRQLVYSMVAARVRRISAASVEAVLDTFFAVVTELAQPFQPNQDVGRTAPGRSGGRI